MKNLIKKAAAVGAAISAFYWAVPAPVMAAVQTTGSFNPCPTGTNSSNINVPGCSTDVSVGGTVQFVINILLFVAFIAALVFLIIGGIRWILSGGDKEGTTKAKGTVTSALIGLVIVLAAWVLVNFVLQFLTGTTLSNLTVPTLGN